MEITQGDDLPHIADASTRGDKDAVVAVIDVLSAGEGAEVEVGSGTKLEYARVQVDGSVCRATSIGAEDADSSDGRLRDAHGALLADGASPDSNRP